MLLIVLEVIFPKFYFSRFRLWVQLPCAGRWTSRPSWRWWRLAARSTWPTGRCCHRSPESGGWRPPGDTSGTRGAARDQVGEAKERMREKKRKKKPVKTKYAATFTSITLASNLILFTVTSHLMNFINFIPFLIKMIIETKMIIIVQWAPLNGINRLMGSNWSHLTNPKLPFPTWCLFISFAN